MICTAYLCLSRREEEKWVNLIVRISYATGGVNFYLRYTNASIRRRTGIGSDTQFPCAREGSTVSVGIYTCLTITRNSNFFPCIGTITNSEFIVRIAAEGTSITQPLWIVYSNQIHQTQYNCLNETVDNLTCR